MVSFVEFEKNSRFLHKVGNFSPENFKNSYLSLWLIFFDELFTEVWGKDSIFMWWSKGSKRTFRKSTAVILLRKFKIKFPLYASDYRMEFGTLLSCLDWVSKSPDAKISEAKAFEMWENRFWHIFILEY